MTAMTVLDPRGTLTLPWPVPWALALDEGDLVAAEPEFEETFRLRFRGYGHRVRSAVASCGQPWPFVAELLRLPLAALGPAGALDLSGLGAGNPFRPGDSLLLRAEARLDEPWFTLEPSAGRRPVQELEAEAVYGLRVSPGGQVILPEDALRALGLSGGGTVAGKIFLNTLEGGPLDETATPGALRLAVGPDGALSLPQALRQDPGLQPGAGVRFELTVSGASARFRLASEEEKT